MDFIFMLTRSDQTVEDCLDVLDAIESVPLEHIGFKDVGVDAATLGELNRRIKGRGAISYMEVVSTSQDACLRSARAAVEIGVDRLLGGTAVDDILAILEGSGIGYYPFPGYPQGHPTRLGGRVEAAAEHARAYMAKGCAGADLLAYRAIEAEPLELVRAVKGALGDGYLIVAGSVVSPDQVRALATAGADAFTIGSALFEGAYSPRKGALASQLRDVLADSDS